MKVNATEPFFPVDVVALEHLAHPGHAGLFGQGGGGGAEGGGGGWLSAGCCVCGGLLVFLRFDDDAFGRIDVEALARLDVGEFEGFGVVPAAGHALPHGAVVGVGDAVVAGFLDAFDEYLAPTVLSLSKGVFIDALLMLRAIGQPRKRIGLGGLRDGQAEDQEGCDEAVRNQFVPVLCVCGFFRLNWFEKFRVGNRIHSH